jgi:hypothetical protein
VRGQRGGWTACRIKRCDRDPRSRARRGAGCHPWAARGGRDGGFRPHQREPRGRGGRHGCGGRGLEQLAGDAPLQRDATPASSRAGGACAAQPSVDGFLAGRGRRLWLAVACATHLISRENLADEALPATCADLWWSSAASGEEPLASDTKCDSDDKLTGRVCCVWRAGGRSCSACWARHRSARRGCSSASSRMGSTATRRP